MAGKVQGITIEFSGNTTQLEAALRKVKASTSAIDKELKRVNTDLRFNPHNTELLDQKQRLLKSKIDATKTSLENFKNIQKQLDAKKVKDTSAEYQRVRRNIIEAESKLRTFNAQLARAKFQGMTNLGKGITAVGDKLTNATRYARRFALALAGIALYKGFQRLKSLDETETQMKALGYRGEKLQGIMDATSKSVDGTRFMLQDMAKVANGALGSGVTEKYTLDEYLTRTADLAQLTGMNVDEMGAIMNKAYSKGKVDARLLNQFNARGIPIYKLLQKQMGVNAKELGEMTRKGEVGFDDLYKATDRYNGLAQEMGTKTLSGAATVLTQQFGLIGADFLTGVYEPIKGGVKGIVASLKELRKSGVFKEWGENLGNAVRYFAEWFQKGSASMAGMSQGSRDLIAALSPVVKTILSIVKAIAGLPPEIQGFLGAFVLFGGPALKVVGSLVSGIANLGANMATMSMNTASGVSAFSKLASALGMTSGALGVAAGAGAALVGWIAAIGVEWYKTDKAQRQYTDSVKEWEAGQQEQIDAIKSSADEADVYMQKLNELMGKENKSATDKAKIKEYVNQLNGAVDGLNLKYDEEKDKLNKTTTAIYEKIEAQKQSALAAAYEDKITEGTKKLLDLQEKERDLIKERSEYTKRYNSIENKTAAVTAAYKDQMSDVNKRIQNNRKAQDQMNKSIDQAATAATNLSPKMQASYNKIVQKAKSAGVKIPQNLKNGIEDGSIKIPTTMNQLYRRINSRFDRAVASARKAGVKIPDSLQKNINKGKTKPAAAAAQIERLVSNKLSKSKGSARKNGRGVPDGYASGINNEDGKKKVRKAAKSVKNAADNATDDNSGAQQSGSWWTEGYANGILADKVVGLVTTAAAKVAAAATKAANKKQQGGSPSRVAMKLGAFWTEGYAIGVEKEAPRAKRATEKVVEGAIKAATVRVPQINLTADGLRKTIGAEIQQGVNVMLAGNQQPAPTNATFNITVDGSKDPETFAEELVRDLKMKTRTV